MIGIFSASTGLAIHIHEKATTAAATPPSHFFHTDFFIFEIFSRSFTSAFFTDSVPACVIILWLCAFCSLLSPSGPCCFSMAAKARSFALCTSSGNLDFFCICLRMRSSSSCSLLNPALSYASRYLLTCSLPRASQVLTVFSFICNSSAISFTVHSSA